MKTIFSALAGLLLTSAVYAQTRPVVTINMTGERNKQITIDGRYYSLTTDGNQYQTVVVPDLSVGTHTIELTRSNFFGLQTTSRSTFTTRNGYDLTLTINSDGNITSSETQSNYGSYEGNVPQGINATAFNRIYTQTRARSSATARTTYLRNEFNNRTRGFTSDQARQLISLVNSEDSRLELAKLAYTHVIDPANFKVVSNLLYSNVNRRELNRYIKNLDMNNPDMSTTSPVTDQRFRTIYNDVLAENTNSSRYYYLTNFFSKDFNYFTSNQAAQLIQLVQGENERFNLAKAAVHGITDRSNFYQVVNLLSSSSNRAALNSYVSGYGTNGNGNVTVAMSDYTYNNLYQSVSYQSSSSRYATVNNAFTTSGNYFSVAQAKKLIALVNSESSRLALAKTAYPVLVDRSNYTQFYEFLPSSYSRSQLNTYVSSYNNSNGNGTYYPGYPATNVAMSSSDYNRIYQEVQLTFGFGAKMSALTNTFNNQSYYFTVEQAKQLIRLVSDESNRLDLAKLAYDNIVDQQNFSNLYDVLSSQSSRDELANWVNNNTYYRQ